ncbi:exosortase C-terminal domain/associated protein EpsI [Phenylobacterium sp.]|jgi:EpsI family protein|uniref:exosortase C-terminal domain/associated protein EpsI n=1 Tax=Phenylobacterium sp. TaxID=1871053 RepID=UPI002F3F1413
MMDRRDFFLGAACVAGAAGGVGLKPRHEVKLLKGGKVADVAPTTFGNWVSEDVGDPYAINGPGTLSAKLYNELVVRQYLNQKDQTAVLMLLAYGGKQSDELQLHRPEVCYPAFGYALVRNEPVFLPIGKGVTVPARRLSAEQDDRHESIIYWSRMGEMLPQNGPQQRAARLEIGLKGIVPDGLLCRFSMVGDDVERSWATIDGFVVDLLGAIPADKRNVLIGDQRANALRQA